ncbi:MAG TPA: serine hydrolase domain-containing protein [Bacillota bacterium]|nr:serine hydrolase domain-containing protein [Bacillota bacterium]
MPKDWEAYEGYVHGLLERHGAPGMSVAVARDGEIVYQHGFGHRDREAGFSNTPTTVHGIGSITKSFTGVAIMQLQERGLLSVNDPVTRYLPEFRVKAGAEIAKKMTIHDFLTHSSGLPPLPSLIFAMADSLREDPTISMFGEKAVEALDTHPPLRTYEELMDFIAKQDFGLLGRPGRYFSYSNDAYGLLGAIIERVSGEPYEQYVMRHIVEPAGMDRSAFKLDRLPEGAELTQLYVKKPDTEEVIAAPGWWESRPMAAAGFLRSNVGDLIRYMEIYRNGGKVGEEQVLTGDSVRQMVTPYMDSGMGGDYGYGLMLTVNYHGFSLVEHGGGIKGVSAYVTSVPEAGITGAALANLGGVPSSQALTAAVNTLLGLPLAGRRFPQRDYRYPEDHLASLTGMYPSGEGLLPPTRIVIGQAGLEAHMHPKVYPVRMIGPYQGIVEMYGPQDEGMPITFLRNDLGDVFAVAMGARMMLKKDLEQS